jgi:Domain of unknown function (DUF4331)
MNKGRLSFLAVMAAAVSLGATVTACGNDNSTGIRTVTDTVRLTIRDTVVKRDTIRFNEFRTFNQVERLGNPLVAEVLLQKRDHDFHDAGTPSTDRANFRAKVVSFITGTAGRSSATAGAIADALLPDMLTLQTDKAANTAGYLSYVLNANAYGGRPLNNDVVDISLMAVFGPLLDANNVSPGLTTDNVPAFGGGPSPTTTFPYLAPPNAP